MLSVAIFSDTRRTNLSPASHAETAFAFYDRVAGEYWDQVRGLIEDWASRLDQVTVGDVRGRLRSRDDRQFAGAFFELYLHECLLRQGYAVTCHPELDGTQRKPDFLAEREGQRLYVEARSTSASDAATSAAARKKSVYDALDRLDSPNFFLWIEVDRQGDRPFAAKPLRRRLERWLAELDPDDYASAASREDFPSMRHEADGWQFTFWAIAKRATARGRPGSRALGVFGGGEAVWVQDDEGIRSALEDKGTAYGALDAPFVVAVATHSMTLDDHDVRNALFGTLSVAVDVPAKPGVDRESRWFNRPDGYWFRGDHWAHRGVSAVLVVKNLHPAFVGSQTHTLWEHPSPDRPVEPLPLWRRMVPNHETGEVDDLGPDRPQWDWFGLGDPWPVGEAFPREV